jgi:hypothetical protein
MIVTGHLRQLWESWKWAVYGAVSGMVIALYSFAGAVAMAALDDPLSDALFGLLPLVAGAIILFGK